MPKITRVNIAAARAQRDILVRRHQSVPDRIQRIAELDPDLLPSVETNLRVDDWVREVNISVEEPHTLALPIESLKVFSRTFKGYRLASSGIRGKKLAGVIWPKLINENLVIVDKDHLGAADEFIHGSSEPAIEFHVVGVKADEPEASSPKLMP